MLSVRSGQRKQLVAVTLAACAPVLAGALLVGPGLAQRYVAGGAQGTPAMGTSTERLKSEPLPEFRGLTDAQQLERAMTLPGIRGVLHGTTGPPTVRETGSGRDATLVTEYPFAVQGFYGHTSVPYATGAAITLRVPGGATRSKAVTVEGGPAVRAGQELFVFVRDQGTVAGGNSGTVLVASDATDVFEVRNGVVYGQGSRARFAEPLTTFLTHFRR